MFAGLDIGNTNAKFSIYYHDGRVFAETSERYAQSETPNRISAENVWKTICRIVRKAAAQLETGQNISAMAVTTFGEAVIPIDRNGKILCDSFAGNAVEGEAELKQILLHISRERIWEITGLLPHRRFPLVKILWYRQHTGIYEKAYKFLQMEDFVLYKLTGNYVVSNSSASRSMAYDRKKHCWSGELLKIAEIDEDKLPEIIPSGSFAGIICTSALKELGLSGKIKMYAGGHDQMCNAVGSGILDSNALLNCSGTVECISGVADVKAGENMRTKLSLQLLPFPMENKTFYFWAPVSGCSSLDWEARILNQLPSVSAGGPEEMGEIHTAMQKRCTKNPARVITIPYFTGRNYPDISDKAKSVIWGMELSTEDWEIYQSLMEGIAFEIRICRDRLRLLLTDIQEVTAAGGGAKSDYWLQMKSNILGCALRRLRHAQSGTMGCMLLAAVGEGYYTSLAEASEVCIKTGKIFYPEPQYKILYDKKYNQYLELRNCVSAIQQENR